MAHAAPNYEERAEFWKHTGATHAEGESHESIPAACRRCGASCVPDARFCHVCGTERAPDRVVHHPGYVRAAVHIATYFASLRDALGQTTASMAALFAGCSCLAAAVVTGFFFNVTTLLDWQAVQLWRIEWLLAAIALMTAGVLLRKK